MPWEASKQSESSTLLDEAGPSCPFGFVLRYDTNEKKKGDGKRWDMLLSDTSCHGA